LIRLDPRTCGFFIFDRACMDCRGKPGKPGNDEGEAIFG